MTYTRRIAFESTTRPGITAIASPERLTVHAHDGRIFSANVCACGKCGKVSIAGPFAAPDQRFEVDEAAGLLSRDDLFLITPRDGRPPEPAGLGAMIGDAFRAHVELAAQYGPQMREQHERETKELGEQLGAIVGEVGAALRAKVDAAPAEQR